MAIIMAIRKIALKTVDKVMQNRLTATLTGSTRAGTLEEKRVHTLQKLFKSAISYSLYFIGIITCLSLLGVDITAVIAGAGILSLAVAFGAQSIVQDLMSGLFIILENQYAVGEYVKIGSIIGKVEEIGLKTTKISTYNGEIMVIPNGKIAELSNYSRRAQRGFVDVGIAYEENIDQAISVIETACAQINQEFAEIIEEPATVLGVTDLAASSVNLRTTFTVFQWKQVPVERALRKAIKEALDQAEIEIAYPKVEIISHQP